MCAAAFTLIYSIHRGQDEISVAATSCPCRQGAVFLTRSKNIGKASRPMDVKTVSNDINKRGFSANLLARKVTEPVVL